MTDEPSTPRTPPMLARNLAAAAGAVEAAERRRLTAIMRAHDAGMSLRTIAGHVALDRRTVAALVDAANVARARDARRRNRGTTPAG